MSWTTINKRRLREEPTVQQERDRSLKYRKRIKRQIMELYGEHCKRCNFNDPRALQIDHIHGNQGLTKKDLGRSGNSLYHGILNGTLNQDDYQLLCANCNNIKRWENGEGTPVGDLNKSSQRGKLYRERIQELYNNICYRCNFSDWRALQIDHIYADHGLQQTNAGRQGRSLYARILNGTYNQDDFQLLCANCNQIKKHENEEHLKPEDRLTQPRETPLVDLLLQMV